jgi:hypothetical protein
MEDVDKGRSYIHLVISDIQWIGQEESRSSTRQLVRGEL